MIYKNNLELKCKSVRWTEYSINFSYTYAVRPTVHVTHTARPQNLTRVPPTSYTVKEATEGEKPHNHNFGLSSSPALLWCTEVSSQTVLGRRHQYTIQCMKHDPSTSQHTQKMILSLLPYRWDSWGPERGRASPKSQGQFSPGCSGAQAVITGSNKSSLDNSIVLGFNKLDKKKLGRAGAAGSLLNSLPLRLEEALTPFPVNSSFHTAGAGDILVHFHIFMRYHHREWWDRYRQTCLFTLILQSQRLHAITLKLLLENTNYK